MMRRPFPHPCPTVLSRFADLPATPNPPHRPRRRSRRPGNTPRPMNEADSQRNSGIASTQHLQSMLLDDGQQLERHAARLLRAGLPFLDRAFADVQVAGKHWLADAVGLANLLDLRRIDPGWHRQASLVEVAHGSLVDRPGAIHARNSAVDRLEGVARVSTLGCHGISPPIL